jgi:hypothetical protein
MSCRLSAEAKQHIPAARDWLADCVWQEMEPEDFRYLRDDEIAAGVERHYEGGWTAFVVAGE